MEAILATAAGFILFPAIYYTLLGLVVIGLIAATEHESTGGAFFALLFGGALGAVKFGSIAALIAAITANPLLLIGGLVGYFVLGTLWMRFKWGLFASDEAEKINEKIRVEGVKEAAHYYASRTNLTEEQILLSGFTCLAPQVMDYKKKITTWIILWVPSFAFFLLNDPLRRLANAIFNRMKDYLQRVSDAIFSRSFKVQIPLPKEKEEIDLTEEEK